MRDWALRAFENAVAFLCGRKHAAGNKASVRARAVPVSGRQRTKARVQDGASAVCRELAAALAVVAIFILTFVPLPSGAAGFQTGLSAFGPLSLCGGAGGTVDDHSHHGACHACRGKVFSLPSPPAAAEPAFDGLVFVLSGRQAPLVKRAEPVRAARPRGPPASV